MKKKLLTILATGALLVALAAPASAQTYCTIAGQTGVVFIDNGDLKVWWGAGNIITDLPVEIKINSFTTGNAELDKDDIAILALKIKAMEATENANYFIPVNAINTTQIGDTTYWTTVDGETGFTQKIGNMYFTSNDNGQKSTTTQMGQSYITINSDGTTKFVYDTVKANENKNPLVRSLLNALSIGN